eukprot:2467657-Prymnesium_polylepis.1
MNKLRADWEVVDEGPMDDLLAIQVRHNDDGTITLHQEAYVRKLIAKYLPGGPPAHRQHNSTPYSNDLVMKVSLALQQSSTEPDYPDLVKPLQERLGALLYLATSTRADLAFAVPFLCRA